MTKTHHIKHQMKESGNTEARPEETALAKRLAQTYPEDDIETQYMISNIAKPDVVNKTKKTAYFCNGEYHESRTQRLRDAEQYEKLKKLGWQVIVLWFYDGFKKENVI